MFEPRKKTIEIEGQQVTIQEITAAALESMGDSAIELVAAGMANPSVTTENVGRWPSSIVMQIAKEIADFNGFSEGNASPPTG